MGPSILDQQNPAPSEEPAAGAPEPDAPPGAPQQSKKHGCFFWGCITALILAVLVGAGAAIAVYSGLKYLRSFTSETPAELPSYTPVEGEYDGIKQRIDTFKKAVDEGKSGVELALTGNDINAIIASDEELKKIRNCIHVKIEGDQISGEASVPLDEIPGFSGLYLNGSASLKAAMANGVLVVTLEDMTVKGEPLPKELMDALRGQNLAKNIKDNPENAELLSKVQDLRVEDGKLILISR